MADRKHTGPAPAFLRSVPTTEAEDRARKLARLEMLANHLASVAALSPNDPELRARVNTAGTACQQLVAFLRRQGGAK